MTAAKKICVWNAYSDGENPAWVWHDAEHHGRFILKPGGPYKTRKKAVYAATTAYRAKYWPRSRFRDWIRSLISIICT